MINQNSDYDQSLRSDMNHDDEKFNDMLSMITQNDTKGSLEPKDKKRSDGKRRRKSRKKKQK